MMTPESRKSGVLHLSILAGLCLLIGIHQIHRCTLINPDGVLYIELAQRLPGDYVGVAQRYPAGYPFILWLAYHAASLVGGPGSSMLWLYSAQSVTLLCRVLALVPLYLLGRSLVGARHSFWALLILIALPYPAQYGSDVLREWPYLLFLSLGFWLLYGGLHQRRRLMLAFAGLAAGLGYLIRPECAQLVLYGLVGLGSLACAAAAGRHTRAEPCPRGADTLATQAGLRPGIPGWAGAGLLLVAGFLGPVVPYIGATGMPIVPHQLRPATGNEPPIISAIGARAASDEPLDFEIAESETLEIPIKASDPQEDPLTFSLVSVPRGSRPVYEFRSPFTEECFWTITESEKDLLLSTYSRQVWDYVGIIGYAYATAQARDDLQAVHRFWSGAQRRHVYTADERQRETLLRDAEQNWTYEGIAFYAFGENNHPPDAVAITMGARQNAGTEDGRSIPASSSAVAWYAHPGGEPPAGAALEGRIFRWRPRIGQAGHYQINIIVSDGALQGCQLVQIRVTAAGNHGIEDRKVRTQEGQSTRAVVSSSGLPAFSPADVPSVPSSSVPRSPEPDLRPTRARAGTLLTAADKLFAGIAEDLMVFFLMPWILGLYCRLRYLATRTERVLIPAVIATSAALVIGRHLGFGAGDDRRYSLALVALTVFYIPVGLDILAWWLDLVHALWCPRRMIRVLPHAFWFCLLLAGGLAICVPKLLMPLRADKASYRAAAQWLQQNTKADDLLAVPDIRISFYAQRQGLPYRQYPNSRRADYIVRIEEATGGQVPDDWRREYSVTADRRTGKNLVIYRTARSPR